MMKKQAIPLGRIFGIPIGLDYSWFLIFALITWMLATSYYPDEFANWSTPLYWIMGALTAILFFGSVVLHELGHSVVAMRYKIPVRSITLFIFGGIAQIGSEPPSALAEFWIAIAGPLVSFALAGLFGILQTAAGSTPFLALAQYLATINGVLGLFNLIPGFPLDGGRVFRAIVWAFTHSLRRATLVAANVGRLIAYLFILFGVWQLLGGDLGGLWIAFIGWFLESAAASQVQQQEIEDLLTGHKVSEAMTREYSSIPASTSLQSLVDQHILGSGRRSFMVIDGDNIVGLATVHGVKKVPTEDWPFTRASQVMIPLADLKWVQPDAELWLALEEMDRDGVNQMPVMANRRVLGMLTRDGIISFLRNVRDVGRHQQAASRA